MNKFCPNCPNYYKEVKFKNGIIDICYFHKDPYFDPSHNNRWPKNTTVEDLIRVKCKYTFLPLGILEHVLCDLTNCQKIPDKCIYKMELELIEPNL